MKKKTEPIKGSRRVEAWIYTVINPLIEALKVEKSFLKDRNWTWRYETKSLEFILPLENYIDSASLPNFQQFFKAYLAIEQMRKKHEDLRAALSENCQVVFNHLIAVDAFQEKARSSRSAYGEYPGGGCSGRGF